MLLSLPFQSPFAAQLWRFSTCKNSNCGAPIVHMFRTHHQRREWARDPFVNPNSTNPYRSLPGLPYVLHASAGPEAPNGDFVTARAAFAAARLPANAPPPGFEPADDRPGPAPAAPPLRARFALDEAPAVTREIQDAVRQQEALLADARDVRRRAADDASAPGAPPPNIPAPPTSAPSHAQLTLVTTAMEGPGCTRGEPQDGRPAHTPMGQQHPARLTKTLITNA